MSLLDPGTARAGAAMTDAALVEAMLRVEDAWLVVRGHAPSGMAGDVSAELVAQLAARAEDAGNPVVPLVATMRERLRAAGDDETATAVHQGLTSQDVLDTALVLCARDAADEADERLRRAIGRLIELSRTHRDDLRTGRTLTQPAVPTTFGLTAATWLHGLLDATDGLALAGRRLPVQLGGAAGTLAGPSTQGLPDPAGSLAGQLGLPNALPWHTTRAPITRLGDALVEVHDACGHLVRDVLIASRPEIGELREGAGGGSSTMPHKHNPVLSVLINAAAIAAPMYGATLHAAAATQVDQRADGGWHAEWSALARLCRSAITTASRTAELLDHLVVDAARMRTNAEACAGDLLAEAGKLGGTPTCLDDYLGDATHLVEQVIARADHYLEQQR